LVGGAREALRPPWQHPSLQTPPQGPPPPTPHPLPPTRLKQLDVCVEQITLGHVDVLVAQLMHQPQDARGDGGLVLRGWSAAVAAGGWVGLSACLSAAACCIALSLFVVSQEPPTSPTPAREASPCDTKLCWQMAACCCCPSERSCPAPVVKGQGEGEGQARASRG